MKVLLSLVLVICLGTNLSYGLSNYSFPNSVLFGGADCAFLVEGAYVEDGKGWSLWDNLTHAFPETVAGTVKNGDTAADFYHKYKEDIALAASLGHDFFKFSISWPRVLPNGTLNSLNQAGLDFYNDVIDTIIKNGMKAHVVMFNFDIPMTLENLGGFANESTVNLFGDYADLLYKTYGDRVTTWITVNEAHAYCQIIPDSLLFGKIPQNLGVLEYQCGHNIIKAHALAYRIYDEKYRNLQGGKVSMAFSMYWFYPGTNSTEDIAAAERARVFIFDWFAHPIVKGDYPDVLKNQIAKISALEGLSESRLPSFTDDEIKYIQGTYDFVGINALFGAYAFHVSDTPLLNPSTANDSRIQRVFPQEFDHSGVYISTPQAFRESIQFVSNFCHGCDLYFTEHGWGTPDTSLNDTGRITFFQRYLDQILLAIHEDGVNVIAYAVWQFMDGFYFYTGLVNRFGLVQVDYNSTNLTRTPRESAYYLQNVIKTRLLS